MPEYPQPGGDQRSQQHFIIFDRFKGLNTEAARTGLPNDQLAWLENLQPLAANKLQIVPAPLPPAVTIAATIVLEFYAAMNNQDWIILFTSAGGGFFYNVTTGMTGQFANDGTFSTAPDCTTWLAERILINDSIAGYCTWDGTLFVQQGGVSPNIQITDGGDGYFAPPTVTILWFGTGGVTATVASPGSFTAPGAGDHALTIGAPPAGGTQAAGYATVVGPSPFHVASVTITNPGAGYTTTPPSVTLPGVTGTAPVFAVVLAGNGATAVATVDGDGHVTGITLTNPGSGFAATDTVTIFLGTVPGAGAVIDPTMSTSGLTSVTINSAGSLIHHSNGLYPLAISAPQIGSDQAIAQYFVLSQVVVAVSIVHAGSGYSTTPAVTIPPANLVPGETAPIFSAVMSRIAVTSLAITAGGSGYPASSTLPLLFQGGGGSPQAAGTATTSAGGVVTGVALSAGGSYPIGNRPTVTVAAGSGATASVHLWPFVPAGTTLAVFQGRVFLAGGQLLQWSGTGATVGYNNQGFDDFLVADLSGALQITDADLVHNITALRSLNNYLWVVGDQSIKQIGTLSPSGAPPFQLLTLSSDQGTIWPKSCISYNRIFLFANPNGIFGVFGSTVQKISDDLDGIFQKANFTQQPQGAVVDLNSKHNAVFLVRYNDPVAGTRSLLLIFDGKRWWLGNQGSGLVAIATAPILTTDINQLWGSIIGSDVTRLLADPTIAQPFKISTALAHADNPVQGKRVVRAGFTATSTSGGPLGTAAMTIDTEGANGTSNNMMLAHGIALTGGANDSNDEPIGGVGVYLGMTVTGSMQGLILHNLIAEYQEAKLWKPVGLPATVIPVIKKIKTDFGALEMTDIPNPTTGFGGSRFYGFGGLTPAPLNPVFAAVDVNAGSQITVNFGATAFANPPPSGFLAWGAATTLDPSGARCALSGGNLTATDNGTGSFSVAKSTASHASGRWYFEATINLLPSSSNQQGIGIWAGFSRFGVPQLGDDDLSIACYDDGTIYFGVDHPQGFHFSYSVNSYGRDEKDLLGSAFVVNDVIGVAVDVDNSKLWFRRNGGAWKCLGTAQAFAEFHIFAQEQTLPVILDMEGGDFLVVSFDMQQPFTAIKQLTVKGIGAKFTLRQNQGMDLGSHAGFPSASVFGAFTDTLAVRLNAVSPGDTVLNVKAPLRTISTGSVTDMFQSGDWCCLDALELQGHAGYPPNQYNCEYVQLAAVTNTQIALTAPVIGTYSDQYPDRYFGSPPGGDLYDPGGAATLHKMIRAGLVTPLRSWDIDLTINDLTIDCSASVPVIENNISGRKFTLNNMTWINSEPNFSQSQRYTVTGGTIGGFVEVDKSVQFMDMTGVIFTGSLQFQSATIQEASFTNCTFQQKFIGQAKSTTLTNCTIAEAVQGLNLGNAYGQGVTLTLANVSAPVVSNVSGQYLQAGGAVFTYASGVFTSDPSAVWTIAVPGLGFLGGISRTFMQAFKIVSVSTTVDNRTVVTTDLPYATLPSVPAFLGGPAVPRIWWHPCPSISCSGCSGSPHLVEWNDAYPQGRAIYSYLKRTCTRDTNSYRISNDGQTDLWGRLVSISYNVTRAYTGAQPNALFVLNWTGGITPDLLTEVRNTISDPTQMRINTKIAGERIVTPTSVTGAQSGDVFPSPFPLAFQFSDGPDSFLVDAGLVPVNLSADPAVATPIVVVTVKTDQSSPFS